MWKVVAVAGARSAFALGLSAGLVLASAVFVLLGEAPVAGLSHTEEPKGASAPAASWHQGGATSTLANAVRASSRLLPAAHGGSTVAAPQVALEAGAGPAAMIARADDHRRKRQFREACDLYAAVAAQGAMNASAWADYADAQASLAGRISGEPARAINAALAMDPGHPKALWLQASLAHEEHRYRDALATWQRLLAVVPPGSSDARIIEANIAEATRLTAT